MKRLLTAFFAIALCAGLFVDPATAQFNRNWEFSESEGNFGDAPVDLSDARALAFGTVPASQGGQMVDRLFISRGSGSQVDILDPSDGSLLGALNTNNVASGATRDLQDISVTPDGVIIACNEVNNPFAGNLGEFKCYRWDHLQDSATEVLSFTPPDQNNDGANDQVGRLVGVFGRADDNTLTILTAATAFQASSPYDNVYRFTTSDNGNSFSSETIDRTGDESTDNLNGVTPLGPGASEFVYNAGGSDPKLYSSDGTYQADISGATSVSPFTNSIRYLNTGSREFVSAFNYESGGNGSFATVVEITNGFESAVDIGSTPSMGGAPTNGAGDVGSRVNSDGTVTFYVVAAGVGLGSYTTTSALPVELASFQATTTSSDAVQLTWTTASETNNAGFRVQRQTEDGAWTQVGFVDSKADGGNTTATQQYRFAVENGLAPGTHRFRLEQVDLDGTTHLSDVVSAEVQMQSALELTAPSPNPVTGSATLSFAVKNSTDATLTLYNVLGQQVRTLYTGTPTAGESQTVRLSTDGLTSGTYLLRLQADGATETQKVTVLK
jgi:hypothetical protein